MGWHTVSQYSDCCCLSSLFFSSRPHTEFFLPINIKWLIISQQHRQHVYSLFYIEIHVCEFIWIVYFFMYVFQSMLVYIRRYFAQRCCFQLLGHQFFAPSSLLTSTDQKYQHTFLLHHPTIRSIFCEFAKIPQLGIACLKWCIQTPIRQFPTMFHKRFCHFHLVLFEAQDVHFSIWPVYVQTGGINVLELIWDIAFLVCNNHVSKLAPDHLEKSAAWYTA